MRRNDRGSAASALLGLALGAISLVAVATLFLAVKKSFLDGMDPSVNPLAPKVAPIPKDSNPGNGGATTKPPDVPVPTPPRPNEEDAAPTFDAAEVKKSIEKATARLNLMGVVVAVLELRGNRGVAVQLRAQMMSEAGRVRSLTDIYKRSKGQGTFESLQPDDILVTFRTRTVKGEPKEAEGEMLYFVATIAKGSRAPITVDRKGTPTQFEIIFRDIPPDWIDIASPLLDDEAIADNPVEKPTPGDPNPKPIDPANPDRPKPPPDKPKPVVKPIDKGIFTILFDAKARSGVNERGQIASEFRKQAASASTAAGWFSAGRVFLEGDDAYWGVHEKGPNAGALIDYFTSQKIHEVATFDADRHLAAAQSLSSKARGKSGEVFRLFGMGHIADAVARYGAGNPKVRSAAESLGLICTDDKNRWGDAHGVAVMTMTYWIGMNQPQKALDAYTSRFKSSGDAATRFVAALAEFALALQKGSYDFHAFHKKLMEYQRLCKEPDDAAYIEMLASMLRNIAGCLVCRGGTALGCAVCQGTGQTDRNTCPSCRGASAGAVDDRYRKGGGGSTDCKKCDNTGYVVGKCTKCSGSGKMDCDSCKGKGWKTNCTETSIWNLFNRTDCWRCQGAGSTVMGAAYRCGYCRGLGYTLSPKR